MKAQTHLKTLRGLVRKEESFLALCVLVGLFARILYVFLQEFLFDDAYITYRFARNLAQGYGFVYNRGEIVYGSSSPLYTLLVSAIDYVSSPAAVVHSGRWIGCLGLLVGVVLLWKKLPLSLPARVLLTVSLLFYPRIFYSSIGGLEEGLIILLMVCSYVAVVRCSDVWLGVTIGLLFMTKFDTLIWIGCILAVYFLATRRLPWKPIIVGVVIASPWIVFSLATFGTVVPHTVEAKQVAYVLDNRFLIGDLLRLPVPDGVRSSPLAWLASNILVYSSLGLAIWYSLKKRQWAILVFPLYCLLYLAALLISDTPFGLWVRWVVPMWIAVFVCFAYVFDHLVITNVRRVRQAGMIQMWAGTAILLVIGMSTPFMYPNRTSLDLTPYRQTGEWLASHSRPEDSILLEPIGAIGYVSNLYVHDFIGLVSPSVTQARRSGNFSNRWFTVFVRQRRPTFIVLREAEIRTNEFLFGGYGDGVFAGDEDQWFKRTYAPMFRNRGSSEIDQLVIYKRIQD